MTIDNVFRCLITLLRIDPTNERVDQLLAELVSQVALSIHNNSNSHKSLRSINANIPSVYYALDTQLKDYHYQLTVKPGVTRGIVTLGIRESHPDTEEWMPPEGHQKPVKAPPTASGAVACE